MIINEKSKIKNTLDVLGLLSRAKIIDNTRKTSIKEPSIQNP